MRDIVVIGAPVGGAAALRELVGALPDDLPATVLAVLNSMPDTPILLADVLNSARRMRATDAADGEPIEPNRIYVAADGKHLMVDGKRIRLTTDAPENNRRPSIDALFRTAAASHRDRVVAVLLLHARDDGLRGLRDVRRNGGRVITHRNDHMPAPPRDDESAEELADDHLDLQEIAPRVVAYVTEGNGASNGSAAARK
ncbi:MAG: chemotaxis protein CheB [Verrucomicrobiota bacterium]|nr:chemotaxis protein CheB [Verrucomicrobiota bacterium]